MCYQKLFFGNDTFEIDNINKLQCMYPGETCDNNHSELITTFFFASSFRDIQNIFEPYLMKKFR